MSDLPIVASSGRRYGADPGTFHSGHDPDHRGGRPDVGRSTHCATSVTREPPG
jgi:hypothetical protein